MRPPDALRSTVWPLAPPAELPSTRIGRLTGTRGKRRRRSPRETNGVTRPAGESDILRNAIPTLSPSRRTTVPTISSRPDAPGMVTRTVTTLSTAAAVSDRTFMPDRLRLTTSPETTRPSVDSTVAGQAAVALGNDRRSCPLSSLLLEMSRAAPIARPAFASSSHPDASRALLSTAAAAPSP